MAACLSLRDPRFLQAMSASVYPLAGCTAESAHPTRATYVACAADSPGRLVAALARRENA